MKTRLLRLIHRASILVTVLVMVILFLFALIRAEAPAVASEMPAVTRFLSNVFGEPVQIESMQLRWRYLLPVFDLHNVSIQGDTPVQISEVKLGLHFILLKDFHITLSAPPVITSSNYFNHIILEQAVINFNQYQFNLNRLDLHKKPGDIWAWKGNGLALDFGKLFLAPILLGTTSGNVHVLTQNGQWMIQARNIAAQNKDILVLANVDLTTAPNTSPVIDLKARYLIDPTAALDLKNYLPQTVLHPDVIEWLTHSIKSVQSGEGSFILKGKLSDFPFDKNPGEFLIDSNITNATLDYFKNWPVASKINAELIFSNTKMLVHVHSAELAYIPVDNIEAEIPVLGKNSVLTITGNVSTLVQNALYFIDHSPLQKTVGKKFEGAQWTGPLLLGLQLNIPLKKSSLDPVKVDGTLKVKNTQLSFPAWKITLKNLTGLLAFTQEGFSSKKLTASYSNSPVLITIDNKNIYHIQYKNYKADLSATQNGGWRTTVFNSAWRGFFDIPPNPMRNGVKGVLYFLNMNSNEMSLLQEELKPSTLPPLNIQIQHMSYKKLRFDVISFQTQHLSDGLFVRYLQINGPGYSVVGQGKWLDNRQSVMDGKLNSNNLASMIASWGLSPSIEGNAAQASFHLAWPGVIYLPNLSHLSGQIDIDVDKGQIITTGSQAKMDFGRLLTILSFQSIQRRLSLDFTDFTKKGLDFNSITGSIMLNNNGSATMKDFLLKSPVASVNLLGSLDLIREEYNLNVTVTPHLTSSLPIVATIAGGPIAGAAVWAASKVVNPLLNKVTEDQYRVTGPWDNPVIKKE